MKTMILIEKDFSTSEYCFVCLYHILLHQVITKLVILFFSILPINVYQLLDDQHLRFVLYCILKIILTTKIIYIIITLKDREKIDIKFRFLFSYFSK